MSDSAERQTETHSPRSIQLGAVECSRLESWQWAKRKIVSWVSVVVAHVAAEIDGADG